VVPITVTFPEAVKAHGNTGLVASSVAPTDPAAPSLATNMAGATSLNLSQYVFGGITFSKSTNKGEAPRRWGSTFQLQEFGTESHEIGQIMLVWGPQDDDTDEVNEAKALLVDGAELWFYIRRGIDADAPFAATEKVETRHVKIAGGHPGQTGDGEFDQYAWVCEAIDLEPPTYDAVIAA
jgi:hypothetical protein